MICILNRFDNPLNIGIKPIIYLECNDIRICKNVQLVLRTKTSVPQVIGLGHSRV
jgi:hypothetical protein